MVIQQQQQQVYNAGSKALQAVVIAGFTVVFFMRRG
jgi:hypothetical protein